MDVSHFKNIVWMYTREITENTNIAFSPFCEQNGLTMLQARILMALYLHKILTIGSLAGCICMAEANVSAMCKKLEHHGLLQRFRDQDDERVVRVTLSGKGADIAAALDREMNQTIMHIVQDETGESLQDIVTGLQKLNDLLQRMNSAAQHTRGE